MTQTVYVPLEEPPTTVELPAQQTVGGLAAAGLTADQAHVASGVLVALLDIRALLQRLANAQDQVRGSLIFGAAADQRILQNWPVGGHFRIVVPDRARGNVQTLAAAAFVDILTRNPGRGGLTLVNTGANGCFVYLARAGDAQNGGVCTGWIAPNGGSWDGQISDELWGGFVSVQSPLGTTIAYGEI